MKIKCTNLPPHVLREYRNQTYDVVSLSDTEEGETSYTVQTQNGLCVFRSSEIMVVEE